ncbi:FRG domain-containing protein [Agrobacterium rosae]|uniref:FRG domain-containing protein n=1 Tax=Agrobacterium rosae TaxID=1972867 RepID=A0AAW9F8M0_9HYPH|nr:FRG domain-containing protein [Agrobacterium rosae]MDX8301501.1 FRG domain-containing protein [Agrobacterium rosae]
MRIVSHNKASDFVDYLRPSAPQWWDVFTARPTHVFRGHARASWKLLPKGWRPLDENPEIASLIRTLSYHLEQLERPETLTEREQATVWRFALAEAAIQFAQLGRSVGLEIPWQVPLSLVISPTNAVPFIDLSLLALAQHHGVPTQMLDWSEDPLTAAFFAIGSDPTDHDDLCVWAMNISVLGNAAEENISLTSAPNVGNANMRAQSGTFLAYYQGSYLNNLFEGGSWPSFENNETIRASLTKITLCGSERGALQDLLLREKRSKAHLMPSWDTVAQTLIDDWKAKQQWQLLSPLEHWKHAPQDTSD